MIKTGPLNLITDVDGIKIGNAEDAKVVTGVTAIIPDTAAIGAVDVRGGGPGTRETEALNPDCLVERVDGVVLSGGSVYGLEAASGTVAELARQGKGFNHKGIIVPIVPSAILFDMLNGGDKSWGEIPPYRQLGIEATRNLVKEFQLGNVGAGYGATEARYKGGLGSASLVTDNGVQVGAIAAANPVGSVLIPGTKSFWAWAFEQNGEFGDIGPPAFVEDMPLDLPAGSSLAENTTICVVATNVALTKSEARRVAVMAHDGIARAIRPVHTPFDGDSIFTLSTEKQELEEPRSIGLARIGAMAADCVARAIARGVYNAESLAGVPGFKSELFKD
ncbi:P1 family peptidase [Sneathiella marina]|uniref:P1 family peptidase n=1 Tax=Sneathiella marina TaxID=2950108 RepID=A0ABY4W4M5_9PROT|nr:P1 family peptidase [Sneathiella marina]USG61769.1 P1 family peptidase [Sneathiella marina]